VPLLVMGLNHRTAPLGTRESVSLSRAELPNGLARLKLEMDRGVLLATCNRTEVYTLAQDTEHGHKSMEGFIKQQFGVDLADLEPYLYTLEQGAAVKHLFRVASGLDSLIIGESEILGQVREAYSAATKYGTAGGPLTRLFHEALRVGKRARSETAIGRHALSVSRACVEMARRALGDLRRQHAVVVGVGDAGRLAARALKDAGLASLTITNRTLAHAEEMAEQLDAEVAPLDELPDLLTQADVVISSTGAPDFILSEALVREAMTDRPNRPLFLIDIAVPRDVDPLVAELPDVHLYTMYDLEMVAEANRQEREVAALHVEAIVVEEVDRFQKWWSSLAVTPTISAIRHQAEARRADEVRRALAKLPSLSTEERERIEAMSKSLVKKLLHNPTRALLNRKDQPFTQTARDLFGLDED
jgi:glutamyl-tRNA reductase